MSIQPEGEDIRRATKWICAERDAKPDADIKKLIETACVKFDLSPREEEFLYTTLFSKQCENNLE